MDLLDKKAIASQSNRLRKVQVDEGVQLAQRIDGLRRTLADLQSQHEKFLQKMKDDLNPQSDAITKELVERRNEILILERKKAKLLEPVDVEWEKVHAKEAELKQKEEELAQEHQKLVETEQDFQKRLKKLSEEERENENLKLELQKRADLVLETSLEAQNTLLSGRDMETQVLSTIKKKTSVLGKKEMEVAIRERNLETREKLLQVEEQEIINEKIRLADQRKTLERAMKRYVSNS